MLANWCALHAREPSSQVTRSVWYALHAQEPNVIDQHVQCWPTWVMSTFDKHSLCLDQVLLVAPRMITFPLPHWPCTICLSKV